MNKFDKESYREVVVAVDKVMTLVKEKLPDDYPNEKHIIFEKFREVSHWMRDIFEIEELKENPHKFAIKSGGKSSEPSGLITT